MFIVTVDLCFVNILGEKIMSLCPCCHRKSYKDCPGFELGLYDDRQTLAAWSMEWSHVEEKAGEEERDEEREEDDKKNKTSFYLPAFSSSERRD